MEQPYSFQRNLQLLTFIFLHAPSIIIPPQCIRGHASPCECSCQLLCLVGHQTAGKWIPETPYTDLRSGLTKKKESERLKEKKKQNKKEMDALNLWKKSGPFLSLWCGGSHVRRGEPGVCGAGERLSGKDVTLSHIKTSISSITSGRSLLNHGPAAEPHSTSLTQPFKSGP